MDETVVVMTLNEKLAAFFLTHPDEWIDARRLLNIAGFAGWRTRISDVRRPPFNLRIENRWRTVDGYRQSEYRYVSRADGTIAGPPRSVPDPPGPDPATPSDRMADAWRLEP